MPYKQFNEHVRQAFESTSQKRPTTMIATVSLIEGCYERGMSYGRKEGDGKLARSAERLAGNERSGPYVVPDGITITMDEVLRAPEGGVRRSVTSSFASGLVDIFEVSNIKIS